MDGESCCWFRRIIKCIYLVNKYVFIRYVVLGVYIYYWDVKKKVVFDFEYRRE